MSEFSKLYYFDSLMTMEFDGAYVFITGKDGDMLIKIAITPRQLIEISKMTLALAGVK